MLRYLPFLSLQSVAAIQIIRAWTLLCRFSMLSHPCKVHPHTAHRDVMATISNSQLDDQQPKPRTFTIHLCNTTGALFRTSINFIASFAQIPSHTINLHTLYEAVNTMHEIGDAVIYKGMLFPYFLHIAY